MIPYGVPFESLSVLYPPRRSFLISFFEPVIVLFWPPDFFIVTDGQMGNIPWRNSWRNPWRNPWRNCRKKYSPIFLKLCTLIILLTLFFYFREKCDNFLVGLKIDFKFEIWKFSFKIIATDGRMGNIPWRNPWRNPWHYLWRNSCQKGSLILLKILSDEVHNT